MPELRRLYELNLHDLRGLIEESQTQGFQFVKRLCAEFVCGANRFDRLGEALFGLYDNDELIGIGGLNLDPYRKDIRVGRVRHLYIAKKWRRNSSGAILVNAIIDEARRHFERLTLRTDTAEVAAFYEALAFQPTPNSDFDSHHLILSNQVLRKPDG